MKATAQINRSYQTPATLLQKVEKLVKKRGLSVDGRKFSVNAAHNEALMMWVAAEEEKYKKPAKKPVPAEEAG